MGYYDYTTLNLDTVVKDVYAQLLPLYSYKTVIGRFNLGSIYHFIASVANTQYGFILVVSYSTNGTILYKMLGGKMRRDTATWVTTEV